MLIICVTLASRSPWANHPAVPERHGRATAFICQYQLQSAGLELPTARISGYESVQQVSWLHDGQGNLNAISQRVIDDIFCSTSNAV